MSIFSRILEPVGNAVGSIFGYGDLGNQIGSTIGSVDIFGGGGDSAGGGSSGLGNFLAALGTAGIGAYSAGQGADAERDIALGNQAWTTEQNALNRQHEMAMLMAKLAQGSGGGGGSAAAAANVRRQAYADAIQARLQGSQNTHNALQLFLQGVQNPYLKIMG